MASVEEIELPVGASAEVSLALAISSSSAVELCPAVGAVAVGGCVLDASVGSSIAQSHRTTLE